MLLIHDMHTVLPSKLQLMSAVVLLDHVAVVSIRQYHHWRVVVTIILPAWTIHQINGVAYSYDYL